MFWLSCREQKKIFDLKEQGGAHGGAEGKVWDGLGKPFDQTEQRGGAHGGEEGKVWDVLGKPFGCRCCGYAFLGFLLNLQTTCSRP